jgi:hypothetical protein
MKLLQIIKYDELIDSLSINETEKPSIKATDILIETKAAGLSPSDYKMVYTILQAFFFEIQSTLKCSVFPENLHDCYFGSKFSMAALKRFCSDRTLFHKYIKNPEYNTGLSPVRFFESRKVSLVNF